MLIDTHAHLNLKEFDQDREKIIDRCLDNDIYIINVGLDYETSEKAIEIAENRSIERSRWGDKHQPKNTWVSDEYDGEPQNISGE